MRKYKRCLITPKLRPNIVGSKIEIIDTVDESTIYNVNDWINADILIIASSVDITAKFFFNFAKKSKKRVYYIPIDNITVFDKLCAWIKTVSNRNLPGIYFRGYGTTDFVLSQYLAYFIDLLYFYLGSVVNKPSRISLNISKPLQIAYLGAIRSNMISNVRSIISNRIPNSISKYAESFIVKSISNVRSKVVLLKNRRLDKQEISSCPTVIQQALIGINFRVHVCGEKVIAVKIISNVLDYRYDNNVVIECVDLPKEIEAWCIRATKLEGLTFSGIDLLVSGDTWYCFEINPEPGYSFFESVLTKEANNPIISDMLLDQLSVQKKEFEVVE